MSAARPRVLLGRFGAPHGVRGEIRLQSFTADPLAITDYAPLTDAAGTRSFAFASVRAQGKEMLVAKVAGVSTREAAQALRGVEIYAPREALPTPPEEEFYLADLIGLTAETPQGERLGAVVAVRNFGAGDLLEIAPREPGETLLFPFTKAVAPIIDVAGGRIVIDPPLESED